MKELFLNVIHRGGFELAQLLRRIDEYHIEGKLTDAERTELYIAAREAARPQVDHTEEIQQLWLKLNDAVARIEKLEKAAPAGGGVVPAKPEPQTDEWPEYKNPSGFHDMYHEGDKVMFQGKHYVCAAKDGTVYSPFVYPDHWQLAE